MNFEDVKILARAGFTAEEIRAMQVQATKPETEKPAETLTDVPEKQAIEKPEETEKPEEKNDDFVKEITNKIDALTRAIQAGNRLAVIDNKPAVETVDDILKTIMK